MNFRELAEPGPMIPPTPAIVTGVNGLPGEPDELSMLWMFVLNDKPAQIGVSAEHVHRANALIAHHGVFSLNVPVAGIVTAFDRIDMNSSKVMDKFALAGLTRGRATHIDAPVVMECPIQLECRVTHTLALPPMRSVYFADVVATRVADHACDAAGRLLVPNLDFFWHDGRQRRVLHHGPARRANWDHRRAQRHSLLA
jgi:flavin reductase (DIM6/NTAB) family NADH-FMN oxidoreductase RutF